MNVFLKIIVFIVPLLLYSWPGGASPVNGRDSLERGGRVLGGTEIAPVVHKDKKPHSPHRATLIAMALPGAGQVYNDHWWKLPVLYGGAGAAVYGLSWNNRYYITYRDAFVEYTQYVNAKAADPELPYPRPNGWDKLFKPGGSAENINPQRFQDILKTRKNNFKRDRDLLMIVMAGIYVIQILDATVFAHFYDYEISDDLSMRVLPAAGYDPRTGRGSVGVSLTLNF
jgi:hypothetical protein